MGITSGRRARVERRSGVRAGRLNRKPFDLPRPVAGAAPAGRRAGRRAPRPTRRDPSATLSSAHQPPDVRQGPAQCTTRPPTGPAAADGAHADRRAVIVATRRDGQRNRRAKRRRRERPRVRNRHAGRARRRLSPRHPRLRSTLNGTMRHLPRVVGVEHDGRAHTRLPHQARRAARAASTRSSWRRHRVGEQRPLHDAAGRDVQLEFDDVDAAAGGGCDSRSSRMSVRSTRASRIGAGSCSARVVTLARDERQLRGDRHRAAIGPLERRPTADRTAAPARTPAARVPRSATRASCRSAKRPRFVGRHERRDVFATRRLMQAHAGRPHARVHVRARQRAKSPHVRSPHRANVAKRSRSPAARRSRRRPGGRSRPCRRARAGISRPAAHGARRKCAPRAPATPHGRRQRPCAARLRPEADRVRPPCPASRAAAAPAPRLAARRTRRSCPRAHAPAPRRPSSCRQWRPARSGPAPRPAPRLRAR